ncbi:MetQ/NlpA family ABC transporter substrate-binding protein [Bacillus sp. DTU_2020_1000418_1_SI_GHA_SEK_038]|uniref:MetQ/NlpA family ABC transporter substrate-binding protein n=1 Tax=Bacillus sp. DTU_2020_1000418_1_SI_GHA_SEK_038 TaxID=3077585 RepID=UPI0028EDC348|nr:MetQ/NlpA family ABC transporter substrate-binding protein [Bacillus sp. DTU_2020_1000418_1_SI_GHA_SEK_038]WNS74858.1 MetQ/NlpA family ABC transporter substrate-binding protein [Bacillus sp. DTU_2020_1000418_1_SI_GHA_SEK_038]
MKKTWLSLLLTFALVLVLAACGTKNEEKDSGNASDAGKDEKTEEVKTLKVGASNVPHAEILEEAKPLLKEKGFDLEIIPFQDYVLPNKALESKEIDANYFQHIPYLELQIKENNYDFVNAGGVHIEPMGVYSKKYKDLSELPENAHIIISNSVADHGRVLAILEAEGLLKLKEGVDKSAATIEDIVENPKNVQFDTDYEPSLLPQIFNNNEGDAVVINSNFAIDAGLNPLEDSIAIEGSESPYVNIITVRNGDENTDAIKALLEVLHSEDIKNFILEKYEGAVVPAF